MVVMDKLCFSTAQFKVDLRLHGGIIGLIGDSGTGKTFLMKQLEVGMANDLDNGDGSLFKNVEIVEDRSIEKIKELSGKLIIIDRFDYIQNKHEWVKKHIQWDVRNQYILIGRNLNNYGILPCNYAHIDFDGSTIRFRYGI